MALASTSPEVFTVLDGYVTEGYICKLLKKKPLTVSLYRQLKGLPFVKIPGDGKDAIRYIEADVRAWAKENGYKVYPVKG